MKRTSLGIFGVSALFIAAPLSAATGADMVTKAPPPAAVTAPVDGDIGDHAFVEPDFLDLAWHLADFVRSNVAELANNAPRKEWQSAAKGAVVLEIPGV